MVINRGDFKRKRKGNDSTSIILDDSPKRTKVHAQRKFAQGSNVSSPVITPVTEIEKQEKTKPDVLPEPIELLPIKRPNTEDFLTFLCFRGTPILPPSLNFFNTSSMVDTRSNTQETKEEVNNGPIPASAIIKATNESTSDRPFIAFGVRKRADPMVISKQMDKKRRHALTLQALRRKYEEQKMAKIRAITISKLSEKVQSKTLVRTRSVTKNEAMVGKSIPHKTKVIATKHVKVAPRTALKAPIKTKIKPKMCLRSFRGRFIQCELQFKSVKKRPLPPSKIIKKSEKVLGIKKRREVSSDFSSDDDQPLLNTVSVKSAVKKSAKFTVAKKSAPGPKKPSEIKLTRSNYLHAKMIPLRRQQMKKKLLLVKSSLTSATPRTTRASQKLNNFKKMKAKVNMQMEKVKSKAIKPVVKKDKETDESEVKLEKKDVKQEKKIVKEDKKDLQEKSLAKAEKKDSKIEKKENKPVKPEKKDCKVEKVEKKETKQEKKDTKVEKPDVKPSKEEKVEKQKCDTKPDKQLKTTEENKVTKKVTTRKEETKKDVKIEKIQKTPEEPKISQRPTRKTKEAAAIYMEILGHKLVNDDDNDDDSISIDSFPELPNVRRTEQRENELKAKAKSKVCDKNVAADKNKTDKVNSGDKNKLKSGTSEKVKDKGETKAKINEDAVKNVMNEVQAVVNIEKKVLQSTRDEKKETLDKRKIDVKKQPVKNEDIPELEDTRKTRMMKKIESKENKERSKKSVSPAKDENLESNRRQTRFGQNKPIYDSDSDESFYADIKIPRVTRKPLRHKKPKSYKSFSNSNDSLMFSDFEDFKIDNKNILLKNDSHSDSERSTTSEIIEKNLKIETLKKKSVAKSKLENSFSDSDEEPLSKFTQNKHEIKDNATALKNVKNISKKDKKDDVLKKGKNTNQTIQGKEIKQKNKNEEIKSLVSEKPKRECTKRPQNYLTLFSSSDDDDKYFHGFVENELKNVKNSKIQENKCSHTVPSADLLCKDVGRRFGKGKVNMSNEQIEKWLKDSAMAGTSIKKENDEMLKFGEKIPAEVELNMSIKMDIETIKPTFNKENCESKEYRKEECDVKQPESLLKSQNTSSLEKQFESKAILPKPPISTDRKLIFRKQKKNLAPNINAFSANNESSIYAFGEDNEDIISTPFRRPNRRPSSTATSRSEDELFKTDDSQKQNGKFRMPVVKTETKTQQNKEVSIVVSSDDVNSSMSSIAVQVNLETSDSFVDNTNTECSAQTETYENKQCLYSSKQDSQLPQGNPSKSEVCNVTIKSSAVIQKSEEKLISTMFPPTQKTKITDKYLIKIPNPKTSDRNSETSEELKYKIPSSPSASSSSSAKIYKRNPCKPRLRPIEHCVPINVGHFPSTDGQPQMVEAPVFYPNDKEFQDPIEYIDKIRAIAEKFGICRIVPPANFKPECKVTDDMRFTAYNQFVHKMLRRWGPNFKELMAIKKYLGTQNINLTHPPWIGGMEIDLPRLYQTVQTLGGLKEVIEKKKWPKVSEAMKIPKSAQDRVTKLDDIYCKYLLPYDTLSPAEREKLFDEVETEWAKRESRTLLKAQQKINEDESNNELESESEDEAEECIVKGRSMALNAFYRIARNTMSMWFKTTEPTAQEVEQEFWKHVTLKQNHICVHSGSIDSGNWGYGFAVSKNSPFARHAWNLKVLTNNSGSVLRSMGPIMGVTVPTLHVGMVFSACCWYRDPHSLPWIEYLHTGANKIWYGIPDSMSEIFRNAVTKLVPNYCRNKALWLPSDTAMVPPSLLVENGVSLCRTVQEPGQFIVIFPKAFTSSISTGYVVSESVYFAPPYWLNNAHKVFDELRNSCESSMFSLDRLLLSICVDPRSNVEVLKQITPAIEKLYIKEKRNRDKLRELGVSASEKLPLPDGPGARKRKKLQDDDGDYECEICRMNLFLSLVTESQEDGVFCLEHAVEKIQQKKIQSKHCKLMFTYSDEELCNLSDRVKVSIENKLQKKFLGKYAGLPTMLK